MFRGNFFSKNILNIYKYIFVYLYIFIYVYLNIYLYIFIYISELVNILWRLDLMSFSSQKNLMPFSEGRILIKRYFLIYLIVFVLIFHGEIFDIINYIQKMIEVIFDIKLSYCRFSSEQNSMAFFEGRIFIKRGNLSILHWGMRNISQVGFTMD